jgi:Beta-glucan synthesis-associated protein SKN1/KRE6/Sbg1
LYVILYPWIISIQSFLEFPFLLAQFNTFILSHTPVSDTNAALHFYSEKNARTTNGVLNITTERKVNVYKAFDEVKKEFYPDKKYIQSGMLQSWNKFCFIGGAVEFSAKLPGDPHKGGLWPACKCLQDDDESIRCTIGSIFLRSTTFLNFLPSLHCRFSVDVGELGTSNVHWIF